MQGLGSACFGVECFELTNQHVKVVIGLSHGGHSALAASRVALARASCTRTNGARPQIAASCPPPALPRLPGVPSESVASHLSVCAGRSSEAAMNVKASDISRQMAASSGATLTSRARAE